ncbi:hypothetical protein [Chitinophaga sp. CF118]|nr:hypothetical protein [Chitinophaga sp. CF118]
MRNTRKKRVKACNRSSLAQIIKTKEQADAFMADLRRSFDLE